MSALRSLPRRKAAARDASLVSLFWSGVIGAVLMTPIGLFYWQPISGPDWAFMVLYGLMAVFANWLVIRAYELAEASALQPFAYLQLVFVAVIGVVVFNEEIRANVVIGAAIVVSAGLFTLVRSRETRAVEAV